MYKQRQYFLLKYLGSLNTKIILNICFMDTFAKYKPNSCLIKGN